jgi:hypothetical protein
MGHCVDREMAQSQRGPYHETEAAGQAHYIKWAKIFGILDPCGYYEGFIRIVAIYIKYIQCGVNCNDRQILCSAKVQGYAKAVNNLFKLRSFSPPADLSDPNNMTAILLHNMLQEEDIARQRALLDNFFLPSCVKHPQPENARIQLVTSFLTLWLLVATPDLA